MPASILTITENASTTLDSSLFATSPNGLDLITVSSKSSSLIFKKDNLSISSFTWQDVLDSRVKITHDGSENSSIRFVLSVNNSNTVFDSSTGSLVYVAVDDAPYVSQSLLVLRPNSALQLNDKILKVNDADTAAKNVSITLESPKVSVWVAKVLRANKTFTAEELSLGKVTLKAASDYTDAAISVKIASGTFTGENSVSSSLNLLKENILALTEGGSTTLSTSHFNNASGTISPDTLFTVASRSAALTFTKNKFTWAEIAANAIHVTHDGSDAPYVGFTLTVADQALFFNTGSKSIQLTTVNDDTVISNLAPITLIPGKAVKLSTNHLKLLDNDTLARDIQIKLASDSNVIVRVSNLVRSSNTFTAEELNNGRVSLELINRNNSKNIHFDVISGTAESGYDNLHSVLSVRIPPATIRASPFPLLKLNTDDFGIWTSWSILKGGSTKLNPDHFNIFDWTNPYPTSASFKITSVTQGHFYNIESGKRVSDFTLADLQDNLIAFRHDGSAATPTFSFRVTDLDSNSSTLFQNSSFFTGGIFLSDNFAPSFAEANTFEMNENTILNNKVVATDSPGETLTYSAKTDIDSQPRHGKVTVNADGSFVYTPDLNYHGGDSFYVLASDGKGGLTTGKVTIEIANVNNAPEFSGVQLRIANNYIEQKPDANGEMNLKAYTNINFTALLKAVDADNDALLYSLVTTDAGSANTLTLKNGAVTYGQVRVDARTGSLVFIADISQKDNISALDLPSFDVRVSDGIATDTLRINLSLQPENHAPCVYVDSPLIVHWSDDERNINDNWWTQADRGVQDQRDQPILSIQQTFVGGSRISDSSNFWAVDSEQNSSEIFYSFSGNTGGSFQRFDTTKSIYNTVQYFTQADLDQGLIRYRPATNSEVKYISMIVTDIGNMSTEVQVPVLDLDILLNPDVSNNAGPLPPHPWPPTLYPNLTYSFITRDFQGNIFGPNVTNMNGNQRGDVQAILGELMSYSGLGFGQLQDNTDADLIFYIAEVEDYYNAQAGGVYEGAEFALGVGMQPAGQIRIKDPITGVDRVINQRPGLVVIDDDLPTFDTITRDGQTLVRNSGNGSLFKAALLRHIGEAIGLYQPGFEEVYRTDFDNTSKFTSNYYTSMSDKRENLPSTTTDDFGNYNWGYMPHDIAAIQQLYNVLEPNLWMNGQIDSSSRDDTGPNANYGNSGLHPWSTIFNNIRTIWDIAGTDTFDFSPSSVAVTIDLRPGFNSSVGDNGTTNNLAIAFGTDIENAIGSIYGDTITGNDLDNTLIGNQGDDTLTGGQGSDIFQITLGWGKDTIMDLSQITDARGNARDRIDLRPLANAEAEFIDELRNVFTLQTTDLADGTQNQKSYTSGIVTLKYFNGDAIISYGVLGTQLLDQITIKHVDLITAADFIIP
ncbi:MAG: hypothetical protein RL095_1117 [Verrucomicrobiota bacterium]|jgi:VCBS repeat-containing protein